jgi:hypothetical protein
MNDGVLQLLIDQLKREHGEGKPWVAFRDDHEDITVSGNFTFFSSATEAEEFCDQLNYQLDPFEPNFGFENYIYTPVESLKRELEMIGSLKTSVDIDAVSIADQMAAQGLYLLPGKSIEDLQATFQQGLVYPVLWKKTIDPIEAIADFHVIGHRHNGGQVYETGHSTRLMETFNKYNQAKNFIGNAVLYAELSDKDIDYVLVGRFHNSPLQLDMEGYAQPHSGITLLTAHHTHDHRHEWHESQSLFEPATLSRYFFAGADQGKLRLYNDKLEPTTTQTAQQPIYPYHFTNEYLTTKNWNIMLNQKNHDYLKNQLLYTGFGDGLNEPLKAKMLEGATEFTLPHSKKFGQDEATSTLHFSKSDKSDMYFFNKFDLSLKQAGKDDALTQTYLIGEKHNYTLQERYNLLEGRAVYKEQPKMEKVIVEGKERMRPNGETYTGWKDLNFKETDTHGNFLPKTMFWDHQKELTTYPIKEMAEPYDRNRLLASLEKGNLVKVTIQKDGEEIKGLVAANPRQQRIDFYDANGQKLEVAKVEKVAQTQEQKQGVAQTPAEGQSAATAQKADVAQQHDQVKKQDLKQDAAADATKENQRQGRRQGAKIA